MGICSNCHGHENNQVCEFFKTKMRTRVSLIPNLNCETRKKRIKTSQEQNKKSKKIYCKNEIKIKQGCDKKHTQNWC
jgi:hypothetical protein